MPGRGEYLNANNTEKRSSLTSASVALKSSSVSPGKPTMTSVESASPGARARSRAASPR